MTWFSYCSYVQDLAKSSNPKAVTQTESRPQAFAEVHDAILQLVILALRSHASVMLVKTTLACQQGKD